jgi:hypothetical protein
MGLIPLASIIGFQIDQREDLPSDGGGRSRPALMPLWVPEGYLHERGRCLCGRPPVRVEASLAMTIAQCPWPWTGC